MQAALRRVLCGVGTVPAAAAPVLCRQQPRVRAVLPRSRSSVACTTGAHHSSSHLLIRQLFDRETYTYTYLLADRATGEALLIDPVIDHTERDISIVRELGLQLKYAVNTHMHADHVTGSGLLKRRLAGVRSVISAASGASADLHLRHGDVISCGSVQLECRATPGHTNGCVSLVEHSAGLVFSGDAVLIRGCGRTDFQEGDATTLHRSVHQQIFTLPDHFLLLPAHDYKGLTCSTVGEERKFNPRLSRPLAQFVAIMEDLKLDYPRFIDEALPANKACGLQNLSEAHRALF